MKTKYVIEKGLEVKVTNPTNVFVVSISAYMGDADFYENPEFHVTTKKEVSEILECIDKMWEAYPSGRGGSDTYSKRMPEWDTKYSWIRGGWPIEEDGLEFEPDGINSIIWYDENGVGFNCSFHERG